MELQTKTMNEILLSVFKNNNDSEDSIGKLKLNYNHNEEKYVLEFISELKRGIRKFGEITYQFKFSIDFDSINAYLLDDEKLNTKERRLNLGNFLSKDLKNFSQFTQWLGAFNGNRDLCKEIADFIKVKQGAITGTKYGL